MYRDESNAFNMKQRHIVVNSITENKQKKSYREREDIDADTISSKG